MQRLVAIVGPTGVGKTKLAISIAKGFNGEIVSADSRQVYRHMDVGTAKPSAEEMSGIRHHLIDVVLPNESFGLAEYQQLCYQAIKDILARGRLPLLVGGTGQYVWAVVEGWEVPKVAPNFEFRRALEERAKRGEGLSLYQELSRVDPDAAKAIDPRNVRRVIRALEVSSTTRQPFSRLRTKRSPDFETLMIGLTEDRGALYGHIDARVDSMVKAGLVEEVRELVAKGCALDLPAMSGIGYRQIGEYLTNMLDLDSAIKRIKTETHRFVRHQYSWFRLNDQRIKWFDAGNPETEAQVFAEVQRFIDCG